MRKGLSKMVGVCCHSGYLSLQATPHRGPVFCRLSLLPPVLPLSRQPSSSLRHRTASGLPLFGVLRSASVPAVLRAPWGVRQSTRVALAGQRPSFGAGSASERLLPLSVASGASVQARLSESSQPPVPNPALNRTVVKLRLPIPSAFGSGGRLALRWAP